MNMYLYGMTPEEAHDNYIEDKAYKRGYEDAKKELDRPHGEWIDTEFLKLKECSYCHVRWGMYDVENFNFCPNCGADMRKEGEEK